MITGVPLGVVGVYVSVGIKVTTISILAGSGRLLWQLPILINHVSAMVSNCLLWEEIWPIKFLENRKSQHCVSNATLPILLNQMITWRTRQHLCHSKRDLEVGSCT